MTPKQKRAHNRAAKALVELTRATAEDGAAFDAGLHMVVRSIGASIGTATAAQAMSVEELHEATVTAATEIQRIAAQAYAAYLALEKAKAGEPH